MRRLFRPLAALACAASFFCVLAVYPLPDGRGSVGEGIVPAGAKLEKLFDGGVVLTEGCASAPDGTIYFSDITFSNASKNKQGVMEAGHIWKFDPKTLK